MRDLAWDSPDLKIGDRVRWKEEAARIVAIQRTKASGVGMGESPGGCKLFLDNGVVLESSDWKRTNVKAGQFSEVRPNFEEQDRRKLRADTKNSLIAIVEEIKGQIMDVPSVLLDTNGSIIASAHNSALNGVITLLRAKIKDLS